jgi:hypothetical protein
LATAPAVIKPDRIEWKAVGDFRIDSGRIYVGDSWRILAEEKGDNLAVSLTPGLYDIFAKWHWYDSDNRVASLYGRLRDALPDTFRKAGEFGVDVASAGVVDAGAMDRWTLNDERPYAEWQEQFCESDHAIEVGFYPCEATGSPMLVTSTGFGDGSYEVWTMLEAGRAVGFELRFLDDAGYVNEPPRSLTWMEKAKVALVSPILLLFAVPLVILAAIARILRRR